MLLALVPAASPQKSRKPPDVTVLETRARRGEGKIQIDVRVRVTGEKPVRGLIIYFDLMSPENGVVTTQKAVLDEAAVDPGEERSDQAVTTDPARAVKFKVRAADIVERELRIENSGPFPIE
jgi:hypothetical protein